MTSQEENSSICLSYSSVQSNKPVFISYKGFYDVFACRERGRQRWMKLGLCLWQATKLVDSLDQYLMYILQVCSNIFFEREMETFA